MNPRSTSRSAMAAPRSARGGFTLIEIVIVIAVIAILAGIATPSIVKNIRDSRIARVKSDTKEVASTIASLHTSIDRLNKEKNTYNRTIREIAELKILGTRKPQRIDAMVRL